MLVKQNIVVWLLINIWLYGDSAKYGFMIINNNMVV